MTIDPTDLAWAIALVRSITRDQTEPYARSDLEVATVLAGTAFVAYPGLTTEATYYRPHVAAASIIRSDPDRAISESIDNASQTVRSPEEVARAIMRAYEWVDKVIEDVSGIVGFGTRRFSLEF